MLHTSCVVVAGKYNEHPVTPGVARVTLRQFALAVHASEDVPAACVSLQDRFGLDVNVLLLAAYIGAVHRQTISAEQVGAARTLVDEWHAEVVRPLRGVRRLLKSGPAPAPNERTEEVRNKVAKAELDAELVELDLLDGWASEQQAMLNVPASSELVMCAMEAALRSYSQDPLHDDARQALTMIAAAATHHSEASS